MNVFSPRPRRAPVRARAGRSPLIPSLLATALCAALPVQAADLAPITVEGGSEQTIDAGNRVVNSGVAFAVTAKDAGTRLTLNGAPILVTGSGSAVRALSGASVALNDLTIELGSGSAYALLADAPGSIIETSNVDIGSAGSAGGRGPLVAQNGGQILFRGGSLNSTAGVALATSTGTDSLVSFDGSTIQGARGARLMATSGGLLSISNSRIDIAAGGMLAGVSASGSGSRAELQNTQLHGGFFDIDGGASLLLDNVEADAIGGNIRVMGNSTTRVHSSVDIIGGRFSTVGGYGANINSWGRLSASDASFEVRDGFAGFWLSSDESRLYLTDSTVDTWTSANGHGVEVYGGLASVQGGTITTHGDSVYGLRVTGSTGSTSSLGQLKGTTLEIAGNGGGGVFLGGSTSGVALDDVTIRSAGENVFGIVHMNTAQLAMADNVDIRMTGSNSGAYRSYLTAFGPYWNRATFNNAHIETASGAAFWLQGSNHALTVNNSDVNAGAGSGRLLRVSDTVFTDGSSVATSRIDFVADASTLAGDVVVDSASADVHMLLNNGTQFSGALRSDSGYQVAQLGLDASSQWNVRASSSLGTLEHAGLIAFDAPDASGFKTVTVTGDYIGNGGQWLFNRALGDDASLGDGLVIEGNSSGTATVSVRNAGGAGALTSEGIRLISVGGQSDAQFTLQGRAVAGAYDYFLYKGGVSTPDDGNWYLRSEYVPPVDPPVDPPIDPPVDPPVDPVDPTTPPVDPPIDPLDPPLPPQPPKVERPEPAVYQANRSSALGMFRHGLYDRAGDPAAQAGHTGEAVAWLHVRSNQPDSHDSRRQVQVDGSMDSVLLGVGRRFDMQGEGELQVGAMLGQGRARNDSRSTLTGYTAHGVVEGSSVGAYATWLQDATLQRGLYVDGWLQYGRFRNSVQGEGLQKERYDAHSWTASAEAGYTLPLHHTAQRGIYLQPQLQVIHGRYDADRVMEANGTQVEDQGGGETTTRVGLRLYSRALTPGQGQVHPFVAVNWWSGGNDAAIAMDGELLQRQLPRDIYEAKAGVQVDLSGGWRGWGEISRQSGSMGFRDIGGQLGVSYHW